MKILVVDDGQLAINSLIRILCRVAPDCDYISAMTTDDALTWMRQGPMDAAFLNLEMPGMNGLALARMIQKLQPRCNIIVVTEHPEYALEALQIFVSGFLLKPANESDVRNVLENLRYPPETAPVGIKIQCFGNFEIFVGGRPLSFKRSKSKELLAYLVDRNGATCTNGEMLAVLWEDKPDTASLHSHLRNLIFDLSHTLEDAGVNGLLVRGRSYAQKRVYPKLLRPAHGLLKLHKTPKAAVHCCAAAFLTDFITCRPGKYASLSVKMG